MSVYVDPLMFHGWMIYGKLVKSCHLFADTLEELLAFGRQVGLKDRWLQGEAKDFPHYDLVASRRSLAVDAGAIELSAREAVAKWRKNRRTEL
jgi:hypothetical protein